jgi:hypothetical protein
MIKVITACTKEIDDIQLAVTEIKSAFDGENLLKNTVGLLSFHNEFGFSGVVKSVLESLSLAFNFPIVGMTTVNNGVKNAECEPSKDELQLSLLVMTSDDVFFDVSISDKFTEDTSDDDISEIFKKCLLNTEFEGINNPNKTKALFVFTPNYCIAKGGQIVDIISEILPDVPLFGSSAVDGSPSFFENSFIVSNNSNISQNDKIFDRVAFIKIYGNVEPKFFSVAISKERILGNPATITSAQDNKIYQLNHKPVSDYLNTLGLTDFLIKNGAISELSLMIKEDETMPSYSRTMLSFNAEDGSLTCGGNVKENSIVRIGLFERADMLSVMKKAIKKAVKTANTDGKDVIFAFSCATRYVIFGADIFSELEIMENVTGNIPYIMAYSGGEFCPIKKHNGENVNRFNNQTFSVCVM